MWRHDTLQTSPVPTGCIICFHSISDASRDELRYPPKSFEALCRYWQDRFEMVSLSALLAPAPDAAPAPARMRLAITFDDGYADNAEIAAPILYRMSLEATFFIVTGCLDRACAPHWYDARKAPRMMHWQLARELENAGFRLGSHTCSHARLSQLSATERQHELEQPLQRLRAELRSPSLDFAIPYGWPQDCRELDRAAIRAAGYRCAMDCYGGVYAAGDDLYHLKRMSISPRYHGTPREWQRAWDAEVARWQRAGASRAARAQ